MSGSWNIKVKRFQLCSSQGEKIHNWHGKEAVLKQNCYWNIEAFCVISVNCHAFFQPKFWLVCCEEVAFPVPSSSPLPPDGKDVDLAEHSIQEPGYLAEAMQSSFSQPWKTTFPFWCHSVQILLLATRFQQGQQVCVFQHLYCSTSDFLVLTGLLQLLTYRAVNLQLEAYVSVLIIFLCFVLKQGFE